MVTKLKNMNQKKIRIGTRGSELALWQANHIKNRLENEIGVMAELVIIKTQGDEIQHLSFEKLEGKGFFTKELEDALLANEIDMAVHSCKDLPTSMPKGLCIAAYTDREDPSDILLIAASAYDKLKTFKLKPNALVGTSSSRRKSQLWAIRPDLQLQDIRGNVPTRIQKLRDGHYDAIVLAIAGIKRIQADISDFISIKLPPQEFIPAPAQGVLAIQTRQLDDELIKQLSQLNHSELSDIINTEREVLRLFQGGCQIPLGVYAERRKEQVQVWVSSAATATELPKRVSLKGKPGFELAELAVEKLRNTHSGSVFISRSLDETGLLERTLGSYGFKLKGESLITIKPLKFRNNQTYDWIFFTSKNAVKHYFSQIEQLPFHPKFGVAGRGTEKALHELGYTADFVGEDGNMEKVGREFAKIADNKSVLFPQAADSLQTVQKQLSFSTRFTDLIVYQTSRKPDVNIPETEFTILTSPSNADVYFGRNNFSKFGNLIALGESTAARIESYHIKGFHVCSRPDDLGILETIFSI